MIFNMVGGGSSNPFAMALVNYPQNSTLTATNVDGYKDIADSTSANPQRLYYVSQPSGSTQTCVFTITDGTQTKTETVSGITVGSSQTITLFYRHYLYHRGDECTDKTGGWVGGSHYPSSATSLIQKNSDNIKVYTDSSNLHVSTLITQNAINTNGFTTLYATIKSNYYSADNYNRIAFVNNDDWKEAPVAVTKIEQTYSEETTIAISLSSAINKYLQIRAGNGWSTFVQIYDIWLE